MYGVKIIALTSTGWKVQVRCTADHTQRRSWVWSGVLPCICEHNQLWSNATQLCIVKSSTPRGAVAGACGKQKMPSHLGCVYRGVFVYKKTKKKKQNKTGEFACVHSCFKGRWFQRTQQWWCLHLVEKCIKTLEQRCMSVICWSTSLVIPPRDTVG